MCQGAAISEGDESSGEDVQAAARSRARSVAWSPPDTASAAAIGNTAAIRPFSSSPVPMLAAIIAGPQPRARFVVDRARAETPTSRA